VLCSNAESGGGEGSGGSWEESKEDEQETCEVIQLGPASPATIANETKSNKRATQG